MDRLLAIEVFCKVVEQGSFVRAAERLAMSTTAVSRHIAELEAHLDARLLQRTTRKLHLTDSGARFHERCQQILLDIGDAEMELDEQRQQVGGLLRVSVSVPFGSRHFAPPATARSNAIGPDSNSVPRAVTDSGNPQPPIL